MLYRNSFILKITILLIFIMGSNCIFNSIESCAKEKKILIVYDAFREYGSDYNILNDLIKIKMNDGCNIEIMKAKDKKIKNLDIYNEIYVLHLKKDDERQLEKIRSMLIDYNGDIYYLNEDISKVLNTKNIDKKTYFYLNNVSPFDDLNELVKKIAYLDSCGIKFYVEVPPVFVNQNSKAMVRFAEVLRYAESSGGRIVLRLPELNYSYGSTISSDIAEEIISKIDKGYENYINYWVYPISISVKDNILYINDLKKFSECSDTIFLDENEDIDSNIDYVNIKSYENIIQKISINDYMNLKEKNAESILYSLKAFSKYAVMVDSDISFDEFKVSVDKAIKQEIFFSDVDKMECNITIGKNEIKNNIKGTFLNNKDVTQNNFISAKKYENYFYKEEPINSKEEKNDKANLKNSNKFIELLSFAAMLAFVIILIISRKIERNKFFK